MVGVYEWTLSAHTRKANAALAGMGRTRRILLADTLLADYSDDEIEVILAHELSHHVHHDLWRGMALQTLLLVAGFFVAHLVLVNLAAPLALRGVDDPAGMPLLLLTAGVCAVAFLPVANAMSRTQERRADRYALDLTRQARGVHQRDEAAVAAEPGRGAAVPAGAVALLFAPANPRADRGGAGVGRGAIGPAHRGCLVAPTASSPSVRMGAMTWRLRLPLCLVVSVMAVSLQAQPAHRINVAHRGASWYAPEHTLAAYRLALEQGADYVEQDLAVTKDGHLICLHDPTLERTTNVEELFPERASQVTWEGKTVKGGWPTT